MQTPGRPLQDLMSFMNSPVSPDERKTRDAKSLWSDARSSLMAVSLKLDLTSDSAMLILGNDSVITAQHPHGLNVYLRIFFPWRPSAVSIQAPGQGWTFHLASKSPASNFGPSSGQYTSFAEYRFAIKARCNLLPVNTVQARMGKRGQQPTSRLECHSMPETIGHVLNACIPHLGQMRSPSYNELGRLPPHVIQKCSW